MGDKKMKAYRVLKASQLNSAATEGTLVFPCRTHDYGMASDDTQLTGIKHVSVTLKRSGGYPFFTIPLHDLESCEAPPLEKLTDDHVKVVCRPGAGTETCRYLIMEPRGWSCEKHST